MHTLVYKHGQDGIDIASVACFECFFLTKLSIKQIKNDEAAKNNQRQGDIYVSVKVSVGG